MKTSIALIFVLCCFQNLVLARQGKKIFNQPQAKGSWYYHYPFADKHFILAIQSGEDESGEKITGIKGENTNIYFGKHNGTTDQLFWKTHLFMRTIKDQVEYIDYNDDGVKDMVIFMDTGARGANSFFMLLLTDPKKRTLTRIKDFENIVNPSYDKKRKIILSYGFSGTNHYSIYKLKNNKIYQIGHSFEDTETLDLDKKIDGILKTNKIK
ncbi:XAC2610-related protein [Pedobacter nototheniae]|uniref:XAC2610-related protein n=1 Tax=Pedobacter nototheniae TaxID=2488994 RepID=UPI0029312A18|nr:hypothetical protein [Pedobacter nototheniae]